MSRAVRRTALPDEIRRILNQPRPYSTSVRRCTCAACERLRAQPFTCETCGYVGEQLVYGCTCDEELEKNLKFLSERLAIAERKGHCDGYRPPFWRRHIAERLAEPLRLCGIDGRKTQCAHLCVECPCCNQDGDDHGQWTRDEDRLHAWAIIRNLRALLAQRES